MIKFIKFTKMHGAGNDFVIIDLRLQAEASNYFYGQKGVEFIRKIADRRFGIGCDQLILIDDEIKSNEANCRMKIFNADGKEAGACGNAARCVFALLIEESSKNEAKLLVGKTILKGQIDDSKTILVDMGKAEFDWKKIPLVKQVDVMSLPIKLDKFSSPSAVSIGNPHMVFFCDNVNDINIDKIGATLENHELFPERANVGFAEIIGDSELRLRVWERGCGETYACGTGACAASVIALRKNLLSVDKISKKITVKMNGGELQVGYELNKNFDGNVYLSGSVEKVFLGELQLV